MSIVFNHDPVALYVRHHLTRTNQRIAQHTERLVSGLRINRSADDTSGLAISEKLRAGIAGLAQANRNTQQGINLIQTADGGLGEIQTILGRMRDLAVQAASDTVSQVNREAIAQELNQLRNEIDRIATTTSYNGVALLSGFGNRIQSSTIPGDVAASLETAVVGIDADGDGILRAAERNIGITLAGATAGTYTFIDSSTDEKLTLTNGTITQTIDLASSLVAGSVATGSTIVANFDRLGLVLVLNDRYDDGDLDTRNIVIGGSSTTTSTTTTSTTTTYTNSGQAPTPNPPLISLNNPVDGDGVYTLDKQNIGGPPDRGVSITGPLGSTQLINVTQLISGLNAGDPVTLDFNTIGIAITVNVPSGSNPDNTLANQLNNDTITITTTTTTTTTSTAGEGGGTIFVGADNTTFNQFGIGIDDMRASGSILGLSSTSVSTIGGAQNAIDDLDKAIRAVSQQRGTLGALQNRLASTFNVNAIGLENNQASESAIRDSDFATELTGLTRTSIIAQASSAILVTPNLINQRVLTLLFRG